MFLRRRGLLDNLSQSEEPGSPPAPEGFPMLLSGIKQCSGQCTTCPCSSASSRPAGAATASTALHRRGKWDWWRQSLDSQHFHWQFLDQLDGSFTTFQAIKRNKKHPLEIKIWKLRFVSESNILI
ncbi:uncharacterized protein LOC101747932 isoform X1 [Gallus gallus]|uniref:uncharacterized protein LOC101747932 isoform X1 n=1 Tax=Gallus gallus TaxID=9031 RepID=UPI001AEA48AB|nr:uncharacterized protein LOC101747932 isoform X1 [Gallus gallus]